MVFDLSWLEDFRILAECANFSRAAELRNMTQPALSRRIRALEDWMGATLFERAHQPVELTEAGRTLLPVADRVLRSLLDARDQCQEMQGSGAATLRFSATHSLSLTFFPDWLRSFEAEEPIGAVRLVSDSLQACEQNLMRGRSQFLLAHAHPQVPGRLGPAQFTSHAVGADTLMLVCAPGADGPLFSVPAAPGQPVPYLPYNPESGLGRIVAEARPELERALRAEAVFSSHVAALLSHEAREGRGVAWLPKSLIERDLASGALVRAADAATDIVLTIRLYRDLARLTPRAERFWAQVNRATKSHATN